jgi:hypothetical protein
MLERRWTDDAGSLAGIWYDSDLLRRALTYLHAPRPAGLARASRFRVLRLVRQSLNESHRLRVPAFPACPGQRSVERCQ